MVKSVDFSGKGDIMMEENKECSHKRKNVQRRNIVDLINRLSRIEGQVLGNQANGRGRCLLYRYLIQVSAVNAALNSFNKVLLANHIRSCVAEDIREGKEETIDELVGGTAEAYEVGGQRMGTIHGHRNELCSVQCAGREGSGERSPE